MHPTTKYEINRVNKLSQKSGQIVLSQVQSLFDNPQFIAFYIYNFLWILNSHKIIEIEEKPLKEAWREKDILKMLISKYWEKMKSIFANLLYCKYKKRASSNKPTRTSYKISGYSENLYFSFIFLNIKDLKTNYIYPCYYLIVREGQQQIFDARPHEVTRYLPEHDVYLRFLTKEIESLKVKQRDLERRACEIVMPPIRTQRSDGVDKDGGLNKDPDNTDKEDEMKNKSDEKEKSTIPEYLVKAFEKLIEKCDREGTYFSTLYS